MRDADGRSNFEDIRSLQNHIAMTVITDLEVAPPKAAPQSQSDTLETWTGKRTFWFRTGFLFILTLCIPVNPSFYKRLFSIDFWKITYHDIQSIAAFMPPQLVTIETEEGVF